jgi:hypothetical protein
MVLQNHIDSSCYGSYNQVQTPIRTPSDLLPWILFWMWGSLKRVPITASNKKKKKQKLAPSAASVNKERVLPFPQPDAPINLVATEVTQADIKNLETKLLALYEYRLSQYKEEIMTLQVQLASEAYSSDRGHLELQNASLKEENCSIAQENSTLLAKVVEQNHQRI